MKYLLPCLLFLANSEVISAFALLVMMGMFLWDIARARFEGGRSDEGIAPYAKKEGW